MSKNKYEPFNEEKEPDHPHRENREAGTSIFFFWFF